MSKEIEFLTSLFHRGSASSAVELSSLALPLPPDHDSLYSEPPSGSITPLRPDLTQSFRHSILRSSIVSSPSFCLVSPSSPSRSSPTASEAANSPNTNSFKPIEFPRAAHFTYLYGPQGLFRSRPRLGKLQEEFYSLLKPISPAKKSVESTAKSNGQRSRRHQRTKSAMEAEIDELLSDYQVEKRRRDPSSTPFNAPDNKTMAFSLDSIGCAVPDTVIYRAGEPVLWYSHDSTGGLSCHSSSSGRIRSSDLIDKFSISDYPTLAVFIPSRRSNSIEYFNSTQLREFIEERCRQYRVDGVLQKFVASACQSQSACIRVEWSPSFVRMSERVNQARLEQYKMDPLARLATFEVDLPQDQEHADEPRESGSEPQSDSKPVIVEQPVTDPHISHHLKRICWSIAEHFRLAKCSGSPCHTHPKPLRLTLYFRQTHPNYFSLLYCDQLIFSGSQAALDVPNGSLEEEKWLENRRNFFKLDRELERNRKGKEEREKNPERRNGRRNSMEMGRKTVFDVGKSSSRSEHRSPERKPALKQSSNGEQNAKAKESEATEAEAQADESVSPSNSATVSSILRHHLSQSASIYSPPRRKIRPLPNAAPQNFSTFTCFNCHSTPARSHSHSVSFASLLCHHMLGLPPSHSTLYLVLTVFYPHFKQDKAQLKSACLSPDILDQTHLICSKCFSDVSRNRVDRKQREKNVAKELRALANSQFIESTEEEQPEQQTKERTKQEQSRSPTRGRSRVSSAPALASDQRAKLRQEKKLEEESIRRVIEEENEKLIQEQREKEREREKNRGRSRSRSRGRDGSRSPSRERDWSTERPKTPQSVQIDEVALRLATLKVRRASKNAEQTAPAPDSARPKDQYLHALYQTVYDAMQRKKGTTKLLKERMNRREEDNE